MKFIKLILFILLIFFGAWYFKIGLNLTPSLPRGLYMVSDKQDLKHSDIVKFCLNEKLIKATNAELYVGYGMCENSLKPLLKYIVGLEGDLVTVENNMVFVKHKDKTTSIAMHIKEVDSMGEKVNSILESGIIPKGKAFVYSYNDGSFDSRYFGLVDEQGLVRMEEFLIF